MDESCKTVVKAMSRKISALSTDIILVFRDTYDILCNSYVFLAFIICHCAQMSVDGLSRLVFTYIWFELFKIFGWLRITQFMGI